MRYSEEKGNGSLTLMGKVKVFITVDTEVSAPLSPQWRQTALAYELERDVYGLTRAGPTGIGYQIEVLNRYGLKADFFVEGLFTKAVGLDPLRRIVDGVLAGGQGVQLHVHPEWLAWSDTGSQPRKAVSHHWQLPPEEQEHAIRTALDAIRQAGARGVCAYRAGSLGADWETIRIVAAAGLLIDSSYSQVHLERGCRLTTPDVLTQARQFEGIVELPITNYQDRPGHWRPLAFCACSWAELEHALEQASQLGYRSVVVLSHGFEFLRRPRPKQGPAEAMSIVKRRFERFCEFLARNSSRFTTQLLSQTDPAELIMNPLPPPIQSNFLRTIWRQAEQLATRL